MSSRNRSGTNSISRGCCSRICAMSTPRSACVISATSRGRSWQGRPRRFPPACRRTLQTRGGRHATRLRRHERGRRDCRRPPLRPRSGRRESADPRRKAHKNHQERARPIAKDAVDDELLAANPALRITIPRTHRLAPRSSGRASSSTTLGLPGFVAAGQLSETCRPIRSEGRRVLVAAAFPSAHLKQGRNT